MSNVHYDICYMAISRRLSSASTLDTLNDQWGWSTYVLRKARDGGCPNIDIYEAAVYDYFRNRQKTLAKAV